MICVYRDTGTNYADRESESKNLGSITLPMQANHNSLSSEEPKIGELKLQLILICPQNVFFFDYGQKILNVNMR